MRAAAATLLALAAGAVAAPAWRRQSTTATAPTDTQVLQYALTLENLEMTFYAEALAQYDAAAFTSAGYAPWVRERLAEIASHEVDHVSLLSGALGNDSVAACNYTFPYTDVTSFVGLAATIENVGVSAYAGAAQYITSPTYLTVAAVILSTEARHQSWEQSAILKQQPWSSPYDTPLGLDMVYTIASAFITSCPSTNPALPVVAYPTLTVDNAVAGADAQFAFDHMGSTATNYAIFYSGLGTSVAQLDVNNNATIPASLQGYSYVVISTASAAANVTTSNVVAGPAILSFPFGAAAANPPFAG